MLQCVGWAAVALLAVKRSKKAHRTWLPFPAHLQREYYKTIANLHYVLPTFGGRRGPHSFRMRDNATTVNSRGVPVEQDMSKHVVKDEIFLHHYSIRSAEEYAAKARRGGGIHKTGRHDFSQLKWRDSMSTLDCLDAVRHVQRFQASSRYSGDSNPTK